MAVNGDRNCHVDDLPLAVIPVRISGPLVSSAIATEGTTPGMPQPMSLKVREWAFNLVNTSILTETANACVVIHKPTCRVNALGSRHAL